MLRRDGLPDLVAESPYDPYAQVTSIAFDGQGGFYRALSYDPLILRTPIAGGRTDTLSVRLPGDLYDHRPTRLAVDGQGRLFVAVDPGQIRVFDRAGSFLAAWELELPADLGGPAPSWYHADVADLRLAPDGTLWVLDQALRRLAHYDPLGQWLGEIRFEWGVQPPLPLGGAAGSGAVAPQLQLTEGDWTVEWIDTKTGRIVDSSVVQGGGVRTLPAPPFDTDIALRLLRR